MIRFQSLSVEDREKITGTEEEKKGFERVLKLEKLMEDLQSKNKHFTFFGWSKNDKAFGWFENTLIFEMDTGRPDEFLIRSIWTPPKFRGQGYCKRFLEAMFHYSKKHKVALAAVANSFDAERFDLAKRDFEEFSYAPDKQKRNSMCKLLQKSGFSEVSPTNFHHEEFGEFALRVVKDYQKVWPRYFVANSFWAEDEEFVFEDDQFARLIDWAEQLECN